MRRVAQFLEELQVSKVGILLDDLSSTRAALVAPAQEISSDTVNRVIALSGGLTFVAITPERAATLMIPTMSRGVPGGANIHQPQYVSVEAREGISTGISASDRASTLKIVAAHTPQPRALVKPGHIFPVEARDGGVLVRAAIPEGALDIARLAGFTDAALFVDLLDSNGALMSEEDIFPLADREKIPVISLSELITYRLQRETLVTKVAESMIPTTLAGEMRAIVYRSRITDLEHIALVKGDLSSTEPVLVRVQAEQLVSDIFGGHTPNSRSHLQNSIRAIGAKDRGVVLYLRRPIGELAQAPAPLSSDTTPAPAATLMREYGVGAQILRDLGVSHIELITSTPRLLEGLQNFGITVVAQHPIPDLLPHKGHTV